MYRAPLVHRLVRTFVAASLIPAAVILAGCGKTPQVTGDEECVGAMDALWTAVTSRREPLLTRCAAEIDRLHKSGQLADDAFESLSGVVAAARAGDWSRARASLKVFMKGQRPAPK